MSDKEQRAETEAPTQPETGGTTDIGLLEMLWKLFSSMKTAIVLLLVLALVSVFGTFRNTPDIYRSAWYGALLAVVSLNLLVCSINRFGSVWRRTFEPAVTTSPKQVGAMQSTEQLSTSHPPEEAASRIATALRSSSYRVMQEEDGGRLSIYAAKGRLRIWGPYLTHLSVLVIVLSAIAGAKLGHGGAVVIPEGEIASSFYVPGTEQEKPLGFDVKLHDFIAVFDREGNPSAYKSDLEVFEHGKSIVRKVIDVNHPLTYKGISFIQASYGPMVKLSFRSPDGATAYTLYDVISGETEQGIGYQLVGAMSPRTVMLGGKRLTVFVHEFEPNFSGRHARRFDLVPDPAGMVYVNERYEEDRDIKNWKSLGWVTTKRPGSFKGIEVSISHIEYTKLDLSRNPALAALYAGFVLLLVGVFVSFYVRHRVIRVSVLPADEGASVVIGATSGAEALGFDREFARISEALRRK